MKTGQRVGRRLPARSMLWAMTEDLMVVDLLCGDAPLSCAPGRKTRLGREVDKGQAPTRSCHHLRNCYKGRVLSLSGTESTWTGLLMSHTVGLEVSLLQAGALMVAFRLLPLLEGIENQYIMQCYQLSTSSYQVPSNGNVRIPLLSCSLPAYWLHHRYDDSSRGRQ